MNTLNYTSAVELVTAFNSGVKFEIHYMGAQPVTTTKSIEAVKLIVRGGGARGLHVLTESSVWKGFLPSGHHCRNPWRLVVAQGSAQSPRKGPDITKEFRAYALGDVRAVEALMKPATPEPLLKRFLGGETFHVPKTGEVLHEVSFKKDELIVTLKDPKTGALRSTPRYNHEGKHKYRPERSLVAGTPPKPKKPVNIKVYKHAYNGSLFVIREGEVIPNIRGISNASLVGETTINE